MKKFKTPLESFIGGWYIPEKVCDNLVKLLYQKGYKGVSCLIFLLLNTLKDPLPYCML